MRRLLAGLLLLALAAPASAGPYTLVAPGPPYKVLNAGSRYQTFYLDPAFEQRKTSDGRTHAWCIRKGMIDQGCLCGLRWWETKDPAKAHVWFLAGNSDDMARRTGFSGYVEISGRIVRIGHRLKDAQGGGPLPSENVLRFAMKGWGQAQGYWHYNGWGNERWGPGENPGQSHVAMRSPNFSGGVKAPNYGYDAAEIAFLRKHFGPPWLAP